jgi:hypothetical protein
MIVNDTRNIICYKSIGLAENIALSSSQSKTIVNVFAVSKENQEFLYWGPNKI